jgi:predicted esterase
LEELFLSAEKFWEEHKFEVLKKCRYLLYEPDSIDGRTLVVITLHGYGQNPEDMLRLTRMVMGKDKLIASLAAPNEQFLSQNPSDSPIGYNWGTRNHWQDAIEMHASMLHSVTGQLSARFGIPVERTILMGYSQPVGLNYRYVGTYPNTVGGVIAICGGVPKDWEDPGKYRPVTAPILHIARDQDEFFPLAVASGFEQRLKTHAKDVTFHMIDGPHRFPSKAGALIEPWIAKVIE